MYLSKIELLGFKSFAHKTRITFDKGLTSIVGPNGCGKTNVVDAIRWVLGEQKTSLLRSAKMENIIFNGSRSYKPLSMTEVSITIENTRNVLPTEYTEITVTRRLYRSGDSDYLLNLVPCRLKDIVDLFADTGMGSDAYSVIELKMIEEIINNKSDERLRLFEEAAGITRYKQRRKQTFRQLESTNRDLERVDDVITEVSKKVRSLKSQVRKAEQHHELQASLRELDLTLTRLSYDDYLEKLRPLKAEMTSQASLVQELSTTISTRDSTLQESELQQLEHERRLAEAQKALNKKNNLQHELEKTILQLHEQEKSFQNTIVRITESIAGKKHTAVELEKQEKTLSDEIAPHEAACMTRQKELDELKQVQDRLQSTLDQTRQKAEEIRESISKHQKSGSRLHVTRQKLETSAEHLKNTLDRLEQQQQETRNSIDTIQPSRRETAELIETRQTLIASERKELDTLKKLQNTLKQQLESKKEHLLDQRSRLDQLKNSLLLANSILDNYEGLPEGIAWLEKSKERYGFGCLSDLIQLDAEHRKAINALFGDALGYYVCSTLQEARAGIRSLTQAEKGKVCFLVLELIKAALPSDEQEIEGARKIRDIVTVPHQLERALSTFTRRCYLTRDLDTAERLAVEHPDCTFVTPSGEKTGGAGILFGGSVVENEGLRLGKKAERDRLRKEESSLSEAIRTTEKDIQAISDKLLDIHLEEKEQATVSLAQELASLENKLVRIDMELENRKQNIERTEHETGEAKARLHAVTLEQKKLTAEIDEHSRQHQELLEALENARQEEAESETIVRKHMFEFQNLNNVYKDSFLELEKLRIRISTASQNRESLKKETERLNDDIEAAKRSLEKTKEETRKKQSELESLMVSSGREQQILAGMETAYNEYKVKNQEQRVELRELRRKHEVETQVHEELQRQSSELEKSIDALITYAETRHNCHVEDIDHTVPENFDRDEAGKRLEALRERAEGFGAVNELAFEEYETEKERLDFLSGQKDDLLAAEAQLKTTIEEINKTALKKFEDTFSEVRRNFIRIFRELFEETDEADLILTEGDDPLEAQISIIARPRGKRPLSIEQLSGGEKALTALSLLFAIYLVKPSPFCILDEVDAPLDDANIDRFIKLLRKFEKNTQFIIVTHNKKTMASSQALYGVTMEEEGISKLIPVKLTKHQSANTPSSDDQETRSV